MEGDTCVFINTTMKTMFDGKAGLRTCNTYWNPQVRQILWCHITPYRQGKPCLFIYCVPAWSTLYIALCLNSYLTTPFLCTITSVTFLYLYLFTVAFVRSTFSLPSSVYRFLWLRFVYIFHLLLPMVISTILPLLVFSATYLYTSSPIGYRLLSLRTLRLLFHIHRYRYILFRPTDLYSTDSLCSPLPIGCV